MSFAHSGPYGMLDRMIWLTVLRGEVATGVRFPDVSSERALGLISTGVLTMVDVAEVGQQRDLDTQNAESSRLAHLIMTVSVYVIIIMK